MKAAIVTIGTELLIGQVIDTNSAWLGQRLNDLGVEIVEIRSIPDKRQVILDTFEKLRGRVTHIFTTGGLGPTNDDITKKTIADYFRLGMHFDQPTYDKVKAYFDLRGIPFKEAHREQCHMPDGVILLENNMGTAPGMWLTDGELAIISMPGVPSEMKYIFENDLTNKLRETGEAGNIFHRTLHTAGTGETMLAEKITDIESNLPKGVSISYLPGTAQVRVRISGASTDADKIKAQVMDISHQIEERISKYIFGYDGCSLPVAIKTILDERGKTLSLAESCTGGYLSHLLVSVPGASSFYYGSITAYSYELKKLLLKVKKDTLEQCGAVSEEVVKEMVLGCVEATKSDYAISISGIAGPGGGTPDKPVGTVWIACGNKDKIITKRLQLGKNREMNIKYSANIALILFRMLLVGEN